MVGSDTRVFSPTPKSSDRIDAIDAAASESPRNGSPLGD
jgi:hypothetical protein